MIYTARWGPKGFLTSPGTLVAIDSISTTVALKSSNGSSGDGSASQTDTRGREPQKVTFNVDYLRAAGVDPRAQLESWEALLGKAYPLYIGEERFGPPKMMLTSVGVSTVMLNNAGVFLRLVLAITLEEYVEQVVTTPKKAATSSSNTGSKTTTTKTSETTKTAKKLPAKNLESQMHLKDDKIAAMQTASKSDRNEKKPTASSTHVSSSGRTHGGGGGKSSSSSSGGGGKF